MRNLLMLPALAVLLLALPALADDNFAGRLNIPREQWLSISDVTQKIKAQGYEVRQIEVDDGAYEFKGTNSYGVLVEAHANPATGEVMRGHGD